MHRNASLPANLAPWRWCTMLADWVFGVMVYSLGVCLYSVSPILSPSLLVGFGGLVLGMLVYFGVWHRGHSSRFALLFTVLTALVVAGLWFFAAGFTPALCVYLVATVLSICRSPKGPGVEDLHRHNVRSGQYERYAYVCILLITIIFTINGVIQGPERLLVADTVLLAGTFRVLALRFGVRATEEVEGLSSLVWTRTIGFVSLVTILILLVIGLLISLIGPALLGGAALGTYLSHLLHFYQTPVHTTPPTPQQDGSGAKRTQVLNRTGHLPIWVIPVIWSCTAAILIFYYIRRFLTDRHDSEVSEPRAQEKATVISRRRLSSRDEPVFQQTDNPVRKRYQKWLLGLWKQGDTMLPTETPREYEERLSAGGTAIDSDLRTDYERVRYQDGE